MVSSSDPLYSSQWHFGLLGDIETIWNDYSGAGVTVAIYDDGVDYDHPDLADNYDAGGHVTGPGGAVLDPFPVNFTPGEFPLSDLHGTAVAGIIAGGRNTIGGIGVAWNTTLTGINIFGGGYGDVNGPSGAFMDIAGQATGFTISQNSWGTTPIYSLSESLAGSGFAADLAGVYQTLSEQGRGGLGTIITQAAGNDDLDANGDGVNSSRHTITVAATDSSGFAASYSNFGAAILVTAPAATVTTDLSGEAGATEGDYLEDFGGTSAATPVVTGVIALMLEANPALGWRDVQTILAASATHTGSGLSDTTPDSTEEGRWAVNGAEGWNGGGMHIHTNYGYGMVNAYNAVRLAEVWSLLSPTAATSGNERTASSSSFSGSLLLPEATPAGRQILLTVGDTIQIEHVALRLEIATSHIGNLRVVLVSPEGTEVVVALEQALETAVEGVWVYGIESLRGELSAGTWELRVSDMFTGDTVTVSGASLEIYGATASAADVHHITAEFLSMVALDSDRRTIRDTDGGTDWLSFATVAGDVELTLIGGRSFAVNGAGWGTLGIGTVIENIVTGDGDDTITGNAQDNRIYGMRGDDRLGGSEGNDQLYGGAGRDLLFGGAGADRLDGGAGADTMNGGLGNDRYVVDSAGDVITGELGFAAGGGIDTVESSVSFALASNLEILRLQGSADINGTGTWAPEALVGNAGRNVLDGSRGFDQINGKAGDDTLIGGHGVDWLVGEAGADVFLYREVTDSGVGQLNRDLINGFEHGVDRIDLSRIDANPFQNGDQAFVFIGSSNFGGQGAASAGQVQARSYGGDYVIVSVDIDGNGQADMQIFVKQTTFMLDGDFIL